MRNSYAAFWNRGLLYLESGDRLSINEIGIFILLGLWGLSAGVLTSAGLFAVFNSIGMINRAADVTKTRQRLLLYEDCVVVGAILGNSMSFMEFQLYISNFIGLIIIVIFGTIAGMFVGLFVVSLAETMKVIPIFFRRFKVGAGLGIIILMIGLGKAVGHIIYYLFLY